VKKRTKGVLIILATFIGIFGIGSLWGITQKDIMLSVLGSFATVMTTILVYKFYWKEVAE